MKIPVNSGCNISDTKKELIAVVDDDKSVVEAVVGLMESVGLIAAGFPSAEDFLSSAQLHSTACLILDVRMPGMGGLDLQRHLTARNHQIPIIFITANGNEEFSARARAAGAVEILRKPFSQESLLRAVRLARATSQKDQP